MYKSGDVYKDVPPIIEEEKKYKWCFTKTGLSLTGSAGVITYEIDGLEKKLQLMWYISFDSINCKNFFGVCVGDDSASD